MKIAALALAAVLAAPLAFAASAPAQASGTVSVRIAPGNADQDRAMRAGLAIYGIVRDVQSRGHIHQRGHDNSAGLRQAGQGHRGIVHQEGRGHHGSLSQQGEGHAFGLFQFGRNTRAEVEQTGRGGSGLMFQFGF